MHDDELLRRLAEAVRDDEREERERLDPRWDELAAGRLPAEEEAALRSEAEGSMAGKEAWSAFSPLGAGFRARVVREARELLAAPASGRMDGAGAAAGAPEERLPRPLRRPRPAVRPRHWWAAAAALAAAALLVAVWPEGERPPLPAYEVHLGGEVRLERAPGAAAAGERSWREARIFAPGNRLELVLRPEQAIAGPVEARTYRQEGSSLRPWPLPVEHPAGGAVRVAGTVGREIDLPAGESTLVVVLGRPGTLPAAEEALARLAAGGRIQTRDWLAWRQRLVLPPAAEP